MNRRFQQRRIGVSRCSSSQSPQILSQIATKPPSQRFDSIGAIMRLQAYHFIVILLRMSPAYVEKYYSKIYNSNKSQKQNESHHHRHDYRQLAKTYTWAAINGATLIGNLFVALNWLPRYESIYNDILHMKHYSRLVWLFIVHFLLAEYLWIDIFAEYMFCRDGKLRSLELVFEYGRSLDRTLTLSSDAVDAEFRHKFICLYNRVQYATTDIYFRLSVFGLIAECVAIHILIIVTYFGFARQSEAFGFAEMIVYSALATLTHTHGAYLLAISTFILFDIFFIIFILTFKIKKCMQTLAKWKMIAEKSYHNAIDRINGNNKNKNENDTKRANQSISLFSKLQHQYLNVHRELLHYNNLVHRVVYFCDWGVKLTGTVIVWTLFRTGQFTNNSAGIMIFILYTGIYLAIQLTFYICGYFPKINLVFYRQIAAISVRINTINRRRRCEPTPTPPLSNSNFKLLKILQKNQNKIKTQNLPEKLSIFPKTKNVAAKISTRSAVAMAMDLRYQLRIDAFVHFLAENRFGFTYSNINLMRRSLIMDKFFAAIYFFILILRKFI